MANTDSVGQNTQDFFGSYRAARTVVPVSLAATGNAVVAPVSYTHLRAHET